MDARTPVTIELIASLKLEAADIRKTERIKHSAALALLARQHGYRSWEELMSKQGRAEDVNREIRAAGLPTNQRPYGSTPINKESR